MRRFVLDIHTLMTFHCKSATQWREAILSDAFGEALSQHPQKAFDLLSVTASHYQGLRLKIADLESLWGVLPVEQTNALRWMDSLATVQTVAFLKGKGVDIFAPIWGSHSLWHGALRSIQIKRNTAQTPSPSSVGKAARELTVLLDWMKQANGLPQKQLCFLLLEVWNNVERWKNQRCLQILDDMACLAIDRGAHSPIDFLNNQSLWSERVNLRRRFPGLKSVSDEYSFQLLANNPTGMTGTSKWEVANTMEWWNPEDDVITQAWLKQVDPWNVGENRSNPAGRWWSHLSSRPRFTEAALPWLLELSKVSQNRPATDVWFSQTLSVLKKEWRFIEQESTYQGNALKEKVVAQVSEFSVIVRVLLGIQSNGVKGTYAKEIQKKLFETVDEVMKKFSQHQHGAAALEAFVEGLGASPARRHQCLESLFCIGEGESFWRNAQWWQVAVKIPSVTDLLEGCPPGPNTVATTWMAWSTTSQVLRKPWLNLCPSAVALMYPWPAQEVLDYSLRSLVAWGHKPTLEPICHVIRAKMAQDLEEKLNQDLPNSEAIATQKKMRL